MTKIKANKGKVGLGTPTPTAKLHVPPLEEIKKTTSVDEVIPTDTEEEFKDIQTPLDLGSIDGPEQQEELKRERATQKRDDILGYL